MDIKCKGKQIGCGNSATHHVEVIFDESINTLTILEARLLADRLRSAIYTAECLQNLNGYFRN